MAVGNTFPGRSAQVTLIRLWTLLSTILLYVALASGLAFEFKTPDLGLLRLFQGAKLAASPINTGASNGMYAPT